MNEEEIKARIIEILDKPPDDGDLSKEALEEKKAFEKAVEEARRVR